MRISSAIEYKLRYLKLTVAGKRRLTPFTDKTIYCANKRFERDYNEPPESPYNIFYGICCHMVRELNEKPDWSKLDDMPFDENGMVTEDGETFDGDIVKEVIKEYKNKPKTYQNTGTASRASRAQRGPTFNQGLTYWKHGKEYKYPDQAIDKDTNPCKKPDDEPERMPQDDQRREIIDPVEELKKALRTGKVNIEGLKKIYVMWKNLCPPVYNFIVYYLKTGDIDSYETYKNK